MRRWWGKQRCYRRCGQGSRQTWPTWMTPRSLVRALASAPDGHRRPGPAESADLIRSGLWMRLRPSVPRSARTVRAAVRLMYAGAAVSTVNLIMLLAIIAAIKAHHAVLGYRLTTAQLSQLNTLAITVWIVWSVVPIAPWLWMARATGCGRNWARILSTVLFGFATLDLTGVFGPPGIRVSLVPVVSGPTVPVLTWLAGLAAGWLLWRPASRAFFKPPGDTQAQHQAQKADRAHPRRWPNSRGSGHSCRVRCEPCRSAGPRGCGPACTRRAAQRRSPGVSGAAGTRWWWIRTRPSRRRICPVPGRARSRCWSGRR
jgi:hypothetical protein